jgi:hypothetical protein
MPTAAVARVIGASTSTNGAGAPTSSSSVPCWRCRVMACPDPVSVVDHTPSMPAPMAAYSSDPGRSPARKTKKAMQARITGSTVELRMKKPDLHRTLTWTAQPSASSRSARAGVTAARLR